MDGPVDDGGCQSWRSAGQGKKLKLDPGRSMENRMVQGGVEGEALLVRGRKTIRWRPSNCCFVLVAYCGNFFLFFSQRLAGFLAVLVFLSFSGALLVCRSVFLWQLLVLCGVFSSTFGAWKGGTAGDNKLDNPPLSVLRLHSIGLLTPFFLCMELLDNLYGIV